MEKLKNEDTMDEDLGYKMSMPEPGKVLECIEKWRRLDLKKEPDDEIDKKLNKFYCQYRKPGPLGLVRVQRLCQLNAPWYLRSSVVPTTEQRKDHGPLFQAISLPVFFHS